MRVQISSNAPQSTKSNKMLTDIIHLTMSLFSLIVAVVIITSSIVMVMVNIYVKNRNIFVPLIYFLVAGFIICLTFATLIELFVYNYIF